MAVYFGEDALLEQTISRLFAYIKNIEMQYAWGSNVYHWQKELTITNGIVLTHRLPEQMITGIFLELAMRNKLPYLPPNGDVLFYSWQPGSNIAWHNDYPDKNSMTVYLSKDWNPNHGGYFCWKEWGDTIPNLPDGPPPSECSMKLPEFNNYVFMTGREWHTTTITAPCAPPRLSLQMFFDKEPPK